MPKFRLATVERLREQQEQICSRRLQESTDELARAWKKREDLVAQLESSTQNAIPGDQLVMASMFRDRLREDIARAAVEVDRCSALLGEARNAWLQAKAQLKAVQSLHDRHRDAVRAAYARAEQMEMDELAGTRRGRAVIGGGA